MKLTPKRWEDYLEVIYQHSLQHGHAHMADVSKALGVAKPTTFKALQHLVTAGYIEKESYGCITLTESGIRTAKAVLDKHLAIRKLLTDVLGVSPQQADIDACKIEHFISDETAERLREFISR